MYGNSGLKRNDTVKCESLENVLIEWVWDQYAGGVSISGKLSTLKATNLLNEVNQELPKEQRINLNLIEDRLEIEVVMGWVANGIIFECR